MKSCCVPGCSRKEESVVDGLQVRSRLHSVPYTRKCIWNQWLILCPFFRKYTLLQLDRMKICENHFIPQHYDHEKGSLKRCSLPLLNVPGIKIVKKDDIKHKLKAINPLNSNEPINFKVADQTSLVLTENTADNLSKAENENHQIYLLSPKAEKSNGVPVDHCMYCLPLTAESSNVYCKAQRNSMDQETNNIQPGPSCEGLNTETLLHHYNRCYEKRNNFVSTVINCSVDDEVELVSSSLTLNDDSNNTETDSSNICKVSDVQVYRLLTDRLDNPRSNDLALQNETQPHIMGREKENLFTSKSSITKGTVEIPASFTKEKCNAKARLLIEDSDIKTFYENSFTQFNGQSEFYYQPSMMESIPVDAHNQCNFNKPPECLFAELSESVSSDILETHPSLTIRVPSEPASSASTYGRTNCSFIQNTLFHKNPLELRSKICTDEVNTSNVKKIKAFRAQNKILERKLKASNKRCKRLQLKLDGIITLAKPFLKAYPRLSDKMKELIDTQLRLAGQKTNAARYSDDEKLFALRLYQISPDCYKFLQQYLKLPCRGVIKNNSLKKN